MSNQHVALTTSLTTHFETPRASFRPPRLSGTRLTIVGASRGTGALAASLACEAGATVVAVSRSARSAAGQLAPQRDRGDGSLTHFAADATDSEALRPALVGATAVLVTVGAPGRDRGRVRERVTAATIAAMRDSGTQRLIVQSSLGIGETAFRLTPAMRYLVFPFVLRAAIADHRVQEAIVRSSGLEWTILRPGKLTEGRPGPPLALPDASDVPIRGQVARIDLATWALSALSDATTIGHAFQVVTAR
ncbi:MAG: NAD(P)-dependent oxidoreductase [Cumulibacter sp.]